MLFLRVIAWYGAEKFSLKKSCFYLYIRRYNVSIIDQRRGVHYLGVEEYIPDRIAGLSEKRGYTKYRLSQITGMTQTALGNILSQKSIPRAVVFDSSKKMFTRETLIRCRLPMESRFIYYAVNVRLFNIQGAEDMIVDSVGMSMLSLPDIQYHFHMMLLQ